MVADAARWGPFARQRHKPQVLQAMLAQVAQAAARRQVIGQLLLGRAAEQHLPPMPGGHEPCGAVERRPKVVAVTLISLAGVQAHAHAQVRELRPKGRPGFRR